MKSSDPTLAGGRIEVIDVLRGFALLGIACVHMVYEYYAMPAPTPYYLVHPFDKAVMLFSDTFIKGKFYMIFSFLFGISFTIQLSKKTDNKTFILRFLRRSFILFLIGAVHQMHYRGDILVAYSIISVGLLFADYVPMRIVVLGGIFLALNGPFVLYDLYQFIKNPEVAKVVTQSTGPSEIELVYQEHFDLFKAGTYLDLIKMNITRIGYPVITTFGLFLLGYWAGKNNFIQKLNASPNLKRYVLTAFFGSLLLLAIPIATLEGLPALGITIPRTLDRFIWDLFEGIRRPIMSFSYVAAVILLYRNESTRRYLHNFYAVGRMGLSVYLFQSVVGLLIFSNLGLGLIGETGAAIDFLIGLVLFGVQIVFAQWWFTIFRFGPVEWLWRCLTLGLWIPLIKESPTPSAGDSGA